MVFKKKSFFSDSEKQQIVDAIRKAELMTSGEIKVHIEKECASDPYGRALEVFLKLKMDATSQKNATLIYLAYGDKKFAILGDKGINDVVPANFWDTAKEQMSSHFRKSEFLEGIVFAIEETGKQLKQYFPYLSNDKNELNDEISEG